MVSHLDDEPATRPIDRDFGRLEPAWEDWGSLRPRRRRRKQRRPRRAHDPDRAASGPHRPRGHPQLLHHRPHRPRQVDAGRPDAAADRRRRRAQRAGAVPRPDGHRARARDHHQEPGRPDAVDGAGRQRAGRRARHLRAQHDRHPGARRLHLRGVALARGVRGRRTARRRRAGHRGADPGQPLPRARRRPPHHPGAQQDRPAVRAAREVRRGARRHHRLRPRATCCRPRAKTGLGVPELLNEIVKQTPPPTGTPTPRRAR